MVAGVGMTDGDKEAARPQLRIGECVGVVQHRSGSNAMALQQLSHLAMIVLQRETFNQRIEVVLIADAIGESVKPGVAEPFGIARGDDKALPLCIVEIVIATQRSSP